MVKGLVDRIHKRFKVSIAETSHHDLHQRAQLAIAAVHTSDYQMEQLMDRIRALIDEVFEAELLSWNPEYIEVQQ